MATHSAVVDTFTMGGVRYEVSVAATATWDVWKVTATADGRPVPVGPRGGKQRRAIGRSQVIDTVKQVATHLVAAHMGAAFDAAGAAGEGGHAALD